MSPPPFQTDRRAFGAFESLRDLTRYDMKAATTLHDQGQGLWLDNITRDLLRNGTLARYILELLVMGLTSNPTIFDHAIKNSTAYAAARELVGKP